MKTTSFFIFFTLFIQFSCNPGISEKSQDMLAKYVKDYSCITYKVGKSQYFADTITYNSISIKFEGCANYSSVENNLDEIGKIAEEVYMNSPDKDTYNGIKIEYSKGSYSSDSKSFLYYFNKKTKSLELVMTWEDKVK